MSRQEKAHATGLAGEFHVMEQLYRIGHKPTLSLGSAKSVDILTESLSQKIYRIDVKASRGGGKWPIGKEVNLKSENVVYVFLLYKNFSDPKVQPEAWVIPATDVDQLKAPWHKGTVAVFYSAKDWGDKLGPYKDAWHKYLA